jgi:hypothetical protein
MVNRRRTVWSVLFLLFASGAPLFAGLTLNNNTLIVSTSAVSVTFRAQTVSSFKNLLTGEEYIQKPASFILGVAQQQTGIVQPAYQPWRIEIADGGVQTAILEGSDGTRTARLTLSVDSDDIVMTIHGESKTTGVVSYTFGIQGIELGQSRLIVPSEAGMYYNLDTPIPDVGDDYPVHWETQMAVYESPNGGFSLQGRDQRWTFKGIRGSRTTGSLVLAVEVFAQGPWSSATSVPDTSWRLRAYQGDWRKPAQEYRDWVRGLQPHIPATGNLAWVKNMVAVVTVQNLDTNLLPKLAATLDPSKTLLQLMNWRQQAFDIYYPDYKSSSDAALFITQAHQLGFHVMLHTNLLGVSTNHPAFESMQRYQLKDADTLHPQGWLWDDLPAGNIHRFAYISPASSAYRKLFIDQVRVAVDALKPDALHLDAGGSIVNDGNGLIEGLNTTQGIIQMHKDLINAFPGIALGSESTNEAIAPFTFFAQRWNEPTPPHPIATFLFGDQVLFYGFLDQPTPDETNYTEYLRRYEGQGIMPTAIVSTVKDLGPDFVRMNQLLRQMRLWQDRGYQPDWDSDWQGRIFQYRSADGSSVSSVESDAQTISLKIDGKVFYRRTHDVSRIATPSYILNWPAFDADNLYGLDSTRQYWLEDDAARPTSEAHMTGMPANYQLGSGSMLCHEFSYFELSTVASKWFDFVVGFDAAQKGTSWISNQTIVDRGVVMGAQVYVSPITVGAVRAPAALIMTPPTKYPDGDVFTEYTLAVPAESKAKLSFQVGLDDNSKNVYGAICVVKINGVLVWGSKTVPIKYGVWTPGTIDLTPYAGTQIQLRFIAYPLSQALAVSTWVGWTNIALDADLSLPAASLPIAAAEAPAAVSSGSTLQAGGPGAWTVQTSLPGSFVVFSQMPPQPAVGSTLLDLPFRVWKATYRIVSSDIRAPRADLASESSYDGSGEIVAAHASGVKIDKTIQARPPRNGITRLTWALQVPAGASSLAVTYGLADAPPPFPPAVDYSGMRFSIAVNGAEVWGQSVIMGGWLNTSIDLRAYQGQKILLELVADSQGTAIFDWGHWADLSFH